MTVRQAWVSTFGTEYDAWSSWLLQFGLTMREVAAHEGWRDNPDCPPVVVDDTAGTVTLNVYRTTPDGKRYKDPLNPERAATRRIVIHVDDEIAPFPPTTGNRARAVRSGADWRQIPPYPA